jgi:nucleoside-diphosphate-sugar epimerase
MKEKVIVTGGAGFIGSNLAEALLEKDFTVEVVDDLSGGVREKVPAGAVFHQVDILDTDALRPIFSGAKYVFHCAAKPRVPYSIEHPQETNRVNADGTLSVLVAAKDGGVGKVIYSASSSAYGDQDILPLREDMPPAPVHPYGLQKYIGEEYCRLFSEIYKLPTVSLRYFNVYGPKLNPDGAYALVVGVFLKQKQKGEPLTIVGDGEQTRDFTHVRDVVRANILAAESGRVGKGEVINIGGGKNVTVNQLADLFGGERKNIPPRIEAKNSLADITKAKELLGWEPTIKLEEGIAELKKLFGIA